jgi:membrane-bound lytic murein transglycosylase D
MVRGARRPVRPPVRAAVRPRLLRGPLLGIGFGVLLGSSALAAGVWTALTPPDAHVGAALLPPSVLPLEFPPPPPPGWDISNLDHPRVDYWMGRLQGDRRDRFADQLQRKGRYETMIRAALLRRGMPNDLVFLAMVESGFQPKAYSRAHASGMWQFIPGTATRYGLEMNRAVDERNDPVLATDAALRYLDDLYREFGSWYLAAAAYNTGENRVARLLRAATGRGYGTDLDYYRIWNELPAETRDYVPLMVASARIAKSPATYGFDVAPHPAWDYGELTAAPGTHLSAVARQTGATLAELRELNPHLKLDRVRSDAPMKIRVPAPPSRSAAAD